MRACVFIQYQSRYTLPSTVTSQQMSLLLSEQMYSTCLSLSMTQTFALAGAEAATLLAGGGRALVDGRGLLVALTAGDFAMHLIGQVPQQTHAVLYQLQRWRENGGEEEREEKRSEANLPSLSHCKYITSPNHNASYTLLFQLFHYIWSNEKKLQDYHCSTKKLLGS